MADALFGVVNDLVAERTGVPGSTGDVLTVDVDHGHVFRRTAATFEGNVHPAVVTGGSGGIDTAGRLHHAAALGNQHTVARLSDEDDLVLGFTDERSAGPGVVSCGTARLSTIAVVEQPPAPAFGLSVQNHEHVSRSHALHVECPRGEEIVCVLGTVVVLVPFLIC